MEAKITGWVARDEDGRLYLYFRKPIRSVLCEGWRAPINSYIFWDENTLPSYPEVTFKDEEPTEVELTIKAKE